MTKEESAMFEVLKMANDAGKFAVQLGIALVPAQQFAFEMMQWRGWIRLVDVSPIAEHPDRLFRIFVASPEAMTWYRGRG